ncbi:unnamed protein product [Arctia plantaginis]|uniref:Uncharacterized protein n=1 Tax=Arctia plantaginis TaxID=874455 RepID=A0A8S0Z2T3_ARCPL|nr:unnamed protein product [Arctia plantaginis]
MTEYLISYFRSLDNEEVFKRMKIYEDINAVLLLYVTRLVKKTTSPLWQHLSASTELLKSREDFSVCLVLAAISSNINKVDPSTTSNIQMHLEFGRSSLNSTAQYLEAAKIMSQTKILEEVSLFFKNLQAVYFQEFVNQSNIELNANWSRHLIEWPTYLDQIKNIQNNVWRFVGERAHQVVWLARRTLCIGVAILVLVFLAAPIMLLLLRHIAYTIQVTLQ